MKLKTALVIILLLLLSACAEKKIVTEVKVIKINPPVITQCQRLSIPDCKPTTNGELYECTLTIQKNLNLCADQVDALIKWQEGQEKINLSNTK